MDAKLDSKQESQQRQQVLRELLREGALSTQEELVAALKSKKFKVTQSTISRDLRKIGAIRTTDSHGQTIYRLPDEQTALSPIMSQTLGGLVLEIKSNENMIVIKSSPGSASLVARILDDKSSSIGLLGTIAGDDTVFAAPQSVRNLAAIIKKIRAEF